MKGLVFLLWACIIFTTGCDSRSDLEKLQGNWRLKEMDGWFEFGLKDCPKGIRHAITFSGDEFTFQNGDEARYKVTGTFSCDANRNPKQIVFVFRGQSLVAIYALSSNSLTICVGEHDDVPPSQFGTSVKASRPALLIFERGP